MTRAKRTPLLLGLTPFLATFLASSLALAACAASPVAQPPDMQYGLEECAACRMIVSDPRHAAAVVYDDGRIERFDDVGCLVRHLVEASPGWPPAPETHIWVHGSESQWLNAREARFTHDPSATTPMGYGWLALEENKAADAMLSFEQLPAAVSASQTTR